MTVLGGGPTPVGLIGLGAIGRPIGQRLLGAGVPLRVHSRSEAAARDLIRAGATWCRNPAAATDGSRLILVAVATDADLDAVLTAPGNLLSAARSGTVVSVLGTHHPATIRRLAATARAESVDMLDAPVSGGVEGARDGTLTMFAGGDPDVLDRARDVLELFARSVILMGPVGSGSVAKACNQLVVGSTILAVAEAMTLARASGLDPTLVRDAMAGGYAGSRVLEVHGRRMIDGAFEPGARIDLHTKDAAIVLDLARETGVGVDGFQTTADALRQAVNAGDGALDHAALILTVGRRSRRSSPGSP